MHVYRADRSTVHDGSQTTQVKEAGAEDAVPPCFQVKTLSVSCSVHHGLWHLRAPLVTGRTHFPAVAIPQCRMFGFAWKRKAER